MRPIIPVLYSALAVFSATSLHAQVNEWATGQAADRVLGQDNFTDPGADLNQRSFEEPIDVAVDPTTGKVFVSDKENSRVLRFATYDAAFNGGPAEAVFGQADFETATFVTARDRFNRPEGIFVDFAGRLWVADSQNHRVLRFDDASSKASSSEADGVLGQEDFTTFASNTDRDGMFYPTEVTGDNAGTIWVVDSFNNRVLRFNAAAAKDDGENADGVLGQSDFDSRVSDSATGRFDAVRSAVVTATGSLFVAERNNRRVVRFDNAASISGLVAPDAVLGQDANDEDTFYGSVANALPGPAGVSYLAENDTLFVSDTVAHRVSVIHGASTANGRVDADALLGQTAPGLGNEGLAENRLNTPFRMGVDSVGRLLVADSANNRVLRFVPASAAARLDVRPDLTVGTRPGGQRGNQVYNRNGNRQTQVGVSRRLRVLRYFFNQQNDGLAETSFLLRGRRSNQLFRATYRSLSAPARNVTGSMIRGVARTSSLDMGEFHRYRLDVKPTRKTKGLRRTFVARITSLDPRRSSADTIGTIARTR